MAQLSNIRRIRLIRGMTLEQVAKLVGVSKGQVSRWETGHVDIPKSRLTALANALRCTVADLIETNGITMSANGAPAALKADDVQHADNEWFRKEIPLIDSELMAPTSIYGQSIETIRLSIGPSSSYIYRLEPFRNRSDIFGMFVRGHGMEPVFREGEMILAAEQSPPRTDDNVLVVLKGDGRPASERTFLQVLLKRLVGRNSEYVELSQFNPPATFRIPADQIESMSTVLRLADALTLIVV